MASIARCTLSIRFLSHCCRRAWYIRRVIREETSFEAMLERLYPAVDGRVPLSCNLIPQRWFGYCADRCACIFPSMWKRRCLFRCLMILDWAHRFGIHPTLNVGMRLKTERDSGHCWLSIADQPFCETEIQPWSCGTSFYSGPVVRYWVCMGEGATPSQHDVSPSLLAETGL